MPSECTLYCSIQFNSKALFKDGDPVSLQLIFPGAIQTCEQYNNFSYIYTKQHRFIGQNTVRMHHLASFFQFFSAFPNRFKYRQNAPFTVLVFKGLIPLLTLGSSVFLQEQWLLVGCNETRRQREDILHYNGLQVSIYRYEFWPGQRTSTFKRKVLRLQSVGFLLYMDDVIVPCKSVSDDRVCLEHVCQWLQHESWIILKRSWVSRSPMTLYS